MMYPRYHFLWIWLLVCLMIVVGNRKHSSAKEPLRGDTLVFSGYKWLVKESKGKRVGPGNNYFTGKGGNVWVDREGRLHLRLTFRNGKWFCPEVESVKNFGYGRFHFYLEPFSSELPKEAVLGFFTYDHQDSINYHKEVDIEISKWGKEQNLNSQYVIQPYEKDAFRFNTDFSRKTRHVFDIRKKKVLYKSVYESGLYTDRKKDKRIACQKKEIPYHFHPGNEHVNINVWLFNATAPENEKEFELIISKFKFERIWYHQLLHNWFRKKK